jgi:glycosyltransferase involved in cell wall biosynthesis
MKIGFEAKRFFRNFTGLGNYSRFVVSALSAQFPDDELWLYTPKTSDHPEIKGIISKENIKVVQPSSFYRKLHLESLWRSWGISKEPTVQSLKVFHGLSHELPLHLPGHVRKVVTVHDLIFMRYPQFYSKVDVAIYKAKVKSACERADKIIAISEQTASDLTTFLHIPHTKIVVVYQGAHPGFRQKHSREEIDEVKKRYALPEQYILSVGTIEERKNVIVLIHALAKLPQQYRCPVVIVGKMTPYTDKVKTVAETLGVASLLHWVHHARFIDFPAIYQGACVFVYPSIFEGFGIPLVEAIESGVPVITSTGSCFREAAGPSAKYVDPHDEQSLSENLKMVLDDAQLRNNMIEHSRQYIQKFQPAKIADDLHSVYKALL